MNKPRLIFYLRFIKDKSQISLRYNSTLQTRFNSQFRSLTLGYQNITSSETILAFWEILRKRTLPLYPGEGDRIINMLAEIEQYQYNIDPSDAYISAEALTHIMNRILSDQYSILSQEVKIA